MLIMAILNLPEFITFAAAPIVLTQFVRNLDIIESYDHLYHYDYDYGYYQHQNQYQYYAYSLCLKA